MDNRTLIETNPYLKASQKYREALIANVERNGVAPEVHLVQAWVDADHLRAYQGVAGIVANLERGILLPLLPGMVEALSAEGWMIVSGILDEEWPDVEQTLATHGLATVRVVSDEGWRSGLLRLRA